METTYKHIAHILVRAYEELCGIGSDDKINWINQIPELIEFAIEEYSEEKYDIIGFALISTRSIIKSIDYAKLAEYMDKIANDFIFKIEFDDSDLIDDRFTGKEKEYSYSNQKISLWFDNYFSKGI
jgi:hypothetical protein